LSCRNDSFRRSADIRAGIGEVAMPIAEAVRQWWRGQSIRREFEALDRTTVAALARDNAVPEADFRRLTSRSRTETTLLRRLLQRVGIDPDALARNQVGVMRDMTIVCAGCLVAHRCRRDLDRHEGPLPHGRYCPNAETIEALHQGLKPTS
jgi:hypothetical protein